jgi:hypothetical protein
MELKQLKTFEDACKVEGLNSKKAIPDFSGFPKKDQKAMIAHAKLIIIVRAANRIVNKGKQWKPDWNNGLWDKWYAWFWMDGGSSGFRLSDCGVWRSGSGVGSRLCFISRETGEHVAKQFFKLYKDYFVMENNKCGAMVEAVRPVFS